MSRSKAEFPGVLGLQAAYHDLYKLQQQHEYAVGYGEGPLWLFAPERLMLFLSFLCSTAPHVRIPNWPRDDKARFIYRGEVAGIVAQHIPTKSGVDKPSVSSPKPVHAAGENSEVEPASLGIISWHTQGPKTATEYDATYQEQPDTSMDPEANSGCA